MNREDILKKAIEVTMGDRAKTYGNLGANMGRISRLWNAYLVNQGYNTDICAVDAANMLALMKIARTQSGNHHEDNHVDGAAYVAIAGEIESSLQGKSDATGS